MSITALIGASMVAASALGMVVKRNSKAEKLRRQVKIYMDQCKLDVEVKSFNENRLQIVLPYGMGLLKFKVHIEPLELATGRVVKLKHKWGRTCDLHFSNAPFSEVMDYDDLMETKPLAVPLYSPFGVRYLNFVDETSCHLLIGGATRMGKTVLLRLIAAHIIRKTDGNVRITFIDNKITDLNAFQDLPQVTIAETVGEAKLYVDDLLALAGDRKQKLKAKGNVVDVVDFRKKYPDEPMEPVFVIIDEYGRFSDDDSFQERVIELAETAGYLDIHLIIATQRPDATSAIKPRIKANIVTRVAFTTADENNSNLILGIPDAAHLGQIQGRAIMVDGFPETVQVPYLSSDDVRTLLEPYYRKSEDVEPTGQDDSGYVEDLPNFVKGPTGDVGMPRSRKAPRNRKSNSKAFSS